MFDIAMVIASNAHLGQRDRGGKAYILHTIRVAMRLRTTDEELMSIAVLHDTVEDTKLTFDDLRQRGMSERVINALKLLTHQKGVSYEDYIENMADNLDALLVKREDLRDNSDITRLKGVSEKDITRMAKYHKAFLRVEELIKAHMV